MKVFLNEDFFRYVSDAVCGAEESYYRHLTNQEKQILHNLDSASLDELLFILGKLNHRFAIVVTKRNRVDRPITIARIRAIFRFWKQRVLGMLGKTLSDYGMFIMADREVMEGLTAVSALARGEQYYVVRDYEAIAANIDRMSAVGYKANVEAQAIRMVDAFISETFALPLRIKNFKEQDRYNVDDKELPILFYFSARPAGETVTQRQIALHFGYDYKKHQQIRTSFASMLKKGLIQRISELEGTYVLTGYGVHITQQLRDRIYARA